jgi:hypothetical protein
MLFSSCYTGLWETTSLSWVLLSKLREDPHMLDVTSQMRRGSILSTETRHAACEISLCHDRSVMCCVLTVRMFRSLSSKTQVNSEPTLTQFMNSTPTVAGLVTTRFFSHWSQCPIEITHAIWLNWTRTYPTWFPTWCCRHCVRMCFVVPSYVCSMLLLVTDGHINLSTVLVLKNRRTVHTSS